MIKRSLSVFLAGLALSMQAYANDILKDIAPGTLGYANTPFFPENGLLYFATTIGDSHHGFWRTNGTDTGTYEVQELEMEVGIIRNVGSVLFFMASDSTHARYLWRSDGTLAGTYPLKPFYNGYASRAINDILYIMYWNPTTQDMEFWKSDGSVSGTTQIFHLPWKPKGTPSNDSYMTAAGGILYFHGESDSGESILWRSDGTDSGTVPVKNIYPGLAGQGIFQMFTVGDTLYFMAQGSSTGYDLWKSNGTPSGTTIVKYIPGDIGNTFGTSFCDVAGTLFFSADDGIHGKELWKSDGTDSGTFMVTDLRADSSSEPMFMHALNGKALFVANASGNTHGLFASDGTGPGTVLLKSIYTGSFRDFFSNFAIADGFMYFSAAGSTPSGEIWKTDGTVGGTELLTVLDPGTTVPHDLAAVDHYLLFSAKDSTGAIKPFIYDLNDQSSGLRPLVGYSLELQASATPGTTDALTSSGGGGFSVSLDPFRSELKLRLAEADQVTIRLMSIEGRLISRNRYSLHAGENNVAVGRLSTTTLVQVQWSGGTRRFLLPPI